ncbi:MAG: HAMP domain-containing sensor histidine kinase [Bacteroidia bacterium]
MSSKPYKLIFALLSIGLFFILLLQGFWIRNFYYQKLDGFNHSVYQSLNRLASKLQERENIQIIKHSINLKEGALPKNTTKTFSKVKVIVSSNGNTIINSSENEGSINETALNYISSSNGNLIVTDSVIQLSDHHKKGVVKKQSGKDKKDEIQKLIDKMMLEIKATDASFTENINPDTLKKLIQKEFANTGITLPFEFTLIKATKSKEKVLARSKNFNPNLNAYKSDLSTNKIFSDHNYLCIQFPNENNFILKGMQNILLLSLLFSLLIIGAFYYTLRLILKQKKLSEVKNDFINNMTHELKTPIATISLAVDGLNNPQVKNDLEKFKNYTRILKEENAKLNNHVERVLQMAMLDKGELQLNKKPINLVSIIEAAIDTFKLQAEEQHAKISFKPASPEIIITADKYHLLTSICNLIDNALKYSGKDCEIIISVEKIQSAIVIKVKDNGIGIDPSLHEKVFEKFYRVQAGNLHDTKGFGLGLSYVRSIMDAHKGSIELTSEKGKGSEFILKLKKDVN